MRRGKVADGGALGSLARARAQAFQAADGPVAMLISLKAGGEGLNLQAAYPWELGRGGGGNGGKRGRKRGALGVDRCRWVRRGRWGQGTGVERASQEWVGAGRGGGEGGGGGRG